MNILQELIIIFTLAVIVVYICNRLNIPSIIGFLITGVFAGAGFFGITSSPHDVNILSEVGIILLLFTIGLEFSLKNLMQIGKTVLLGGAFQVIATIIIFAVIVIHSTTLNKALFYGFITALSSTAIVMKIYQEKLQLDTPHGRVVLAILIFQDIIVVPMMLITPILAGIETNSGNSFLIFLGKSLGLIIFVIAMLKWIVPWLFYQLTKTRSKEIFILGSVVTCFSVAGLTYYIGLSLELGAFLAGLIISETEYSYETMGNIIPFRDIFASIFFISIGMLVDISFILQNWVMVFAGGLTVIFLKFLAATAVVILLGFSLRTSCLVGFALSQIGEFSFILSRVGYDYKLLNINEYQIILAISIVTMVISSFIINYSNSLIENFMKKSFMIWIDKFTYSRNKIKKEPEDLRITDHLIVIGFGINGRNVSRSARIAGIPYIVIETNPETVLKEQKKGEKIIYGDAANDEVLRHANIENARVLVTTIPDAPSSRRVIFTARKLNPDIYIIARTRFVKEVNDLFDLGANEVIPEEFETSVEIFSRLLRKFNIPENDIKILTQKIRSDGYQMLRSENFEYIARPEQKEMIKGMEMVTYRVERGSTADGKSISDIALRKNHGVTILSLYRNGEFIYNPDGDVMLRGDDIIILVGLPERVYNVCDIFCKQS
ncbi:MAG TPA: cation:proton antiporter [Spirochaetota bacterium]|nr:cation:proton antiporter [Spirochaetota bacterium]HON16822.1 cation:proton antiporter [Spirochaetota bacterium]